jgi:nicotinamide riboside transporter PnuC
MKKIIIILLCILAVITFLLMNNNSSLEEIIHTYLKIFGIVVLIGLLAWLRTKYDKSVVTTGFDRDNPFTWKNIRKDYKGYWGKNISPTILKRQRFGFVVVFVYLLFLSSYVLQSVTVTIIFLIILLCWGYWLFFKAKTNNKRFKKK